jgi:hypothetical protein
MLCPRGGSLFWTKKIHFDSCLSYFIAYASHTWDSLFELEQFIFYDSHAALDLPLRQWRNGSSS